MTVSKAQVDMAIKEYNKQEIREVMVKEYKKLDELVEGEDGLLKNYMSVKNISESRMMFRIRTKVHDLTDNMRG